jgi:transposase-like protein
MILVGIIVVLSLTWFIYEILSPYKCPYCRSKNIELLAVTEDYATYKCNSCKKFFIIR